MPDRNATGALASANNTAPNLAQWDYTRGPGRCSSKLSLSVRNNMALS